MSRLTDPVALAAKAAAASGMAVAAAHALGVPDALSCGFVAVVCVTPTVYAGLRSGAEQLGGAALAGAVAAPLLTLWPSGRGDAVNPVMAALTVGLSTWTCHRLRWGAGYVVATFTALYLVLMPFASLGEALRVRFEAVLVGVVAATAVNLAVSAAAARSIGERRVRLTRAAVAECLARTAAGCDDPAARGAAADGWSPAFEALGELRADLAAQSREVLLPGRAAVREAAARSLTALDALADVAHLGRHIALLLEGSVRVEAGLGRALSHASGALTAQAQVALARVALDEAAARCDDPAMAAAVRRMARALGDAMA